MMAGSDRAPEQSLVTGFIENMTRPNAKMAFMSSLLCFKNAGDLTPYLERIKAQTMLLWGYKDPIIPVSYAAHFAATIPDCKFVGMEECGHTPYVQYPDRFADLVAGFLSAPAPRQRHADGVTPRARRTVYGKAAAGNGHGKGRVLRSFQL